LAAKRGWRQLPDVTSDVYRFVDETRRAHRIAITRADACSDGLVAVEMEHRVRRALQCARSCVDALPIHTTESIGVEQKINKIGVQRPTHQAPGRGWLIDSRPGFFCRRPPRREASHE